jgi:flagellar operon protein
VTPLEHNPALVPGVGGPAPRRGRAGAVSPSRPAAGPGHVSGPSFAEVLKERAAGVQFSGHAVDRLRRRGIEMDGPTLQRLDGGVARAAAKGARESVVFVDGTAFVVSVRNRTVITAVDQGSMRDHVFTNIDSAVIA